MEVPRASRPCAPLTPPIIFSQVAAYRKRSKELAERALGTEAVEAPVVDADRALAREEARLRQRHREARERDGVQPQRQVLSDFNRWLLSLDDEEGQAEEEEEEQEGVEGGAA